MQILIIYLISHSFSHKQINPFIFNHISCYYTSKSSYTRLIFSLNLCMCASGIVASSSVQQALYRLYRRNVKTNFPCCSLRMCELLVVRVNYQPVSTVILNHRHHIHTHRTHATYTVKYTYRTRTARCIKIVVPNDGYLLDSISLYSSYHNTNEQSANYI